MAHNIEREKEAEGGRDVGESCIAPGWHKLDWNPTFGNSRRSQAVGEWKVIDEGLKMEQLVSATDSVFAPVYVLAAEASFPYTWACTSAGHMDICTSGNMHSQAYVLICVCVCVHHRSTETMSKTVSPTGVSPEHLVGTFQTLGKAWGVGRSHSGGPYHSH